MPIVCPTDIPTRKLSDEDVANARKIITKFDAVSKDPTPENFDNFVRTFNDITGGDTDRGADLIIGMQAGGIPQTNIDIILNGITDKKSYDQLQDAMNTSKIKMVSQPAESWRSHVKDLGKEAEAVENNASVGKLVKTDTGAIVVETDGLTRSGNAAITDSVIVQKGDIFEGDVLNVRTPTKKHQGLLVSQVRESTQNPDEVVVFFRKRPDYPEEKVEQILGRMTDDATDINPGVGKKFAIAEDEVNSLDDYYKSFQTTDDELAHMLESESKFTDEELAHMLESGAEEITTPGTKGRGIFEIDEEGNTIWMSTDLVEIIEENKALARMTEPWTPPERILDDADDILANYGEYLDKPTKAYLEAMSGKTKFSPSDIKAIATTREAGENAAFVAHYDVATINSENWTNVLRRVGKERNPEVAQEVVARWWEKELDSLEAIMPKMSPGETRFAQDLLMGKTPTGTDMRNLEKLIQRIGEDDWKRTVGLVKPMKEIDEGQRMGIIGAYQRNKTPIKIGTFIPGTFLFGIPAYLFMQGMAGQTAYEAFWQFTGFRVMSYQERLDFYFHNEANLAGQQIFLESLEKNLWLIDTLLKIPYYDEWLKMTTGFSIAMAKSWLADMDSLYSTMESTGGCVRDPTKKVGWRFTTNDEREELYKNNPAMLFGTEDPAYIRLWGGKLWGDGSIYIKPGETITRTQAMAIVYLKFGFIDQGLAASTGLTYDQVTRLLNDNIALLGKLYPLAEGESDALDTEIQKSRAAISVIGGQTITDDTRVLMIERDQLYGTSSCLGQPCTNETIDDALENVGRIMDIDEDGYPIFRLRSREDGTDAGTDAERTNKIAFDTMGGIGAASSDQIEQAIKDSDGNITRVVNYYETDYKTLADKNKYQVQQGTGAFVELGIESKTLTDEDIAAIDTVDEDALGKALFDAGQKVNTNPDGSCPLSGGD